MSASPNDTAFERLSKSEPVLVDVGTALDLLPGMTPATVLTSGPAMRFAEYQGGQREALIGGALYEGLARTRD